MNQLIALVALQLAVGTAVERIDKLEQAVCSVFGDPHYRTFDGQTYSFQGNCQYILSTDRAPNTNVTPTAGFSIIAQNDARHTQYSWTKNVTLFLYSFIGSTSVSLLQNQVIEVNGVRISKLPYEANGVKISRTKHNLQLDSYVGVGLTWDGRSMLEITAQSQYRNKLYGMCGNFNGNKTDDFIDSNGKVATLESFTESWRIGTDLQCTPRPIKKKPIEVCQKLPILKQFAAHQACSPLKKHPEFIKCHAKVDPEFQHRSCLEDTCSSSCPTGERCSCSALREYTIRCAKEGIYIHWGEHKHCTVKCPVEQEWVQCTDRCQSCNRYWLNQNGRRSCSAKRCRPGCQCRNGLIKYRGECVKPTTCPLKYRLHGLPLRYYEGNWGRTDKRKLQELYDQLHLKRKNESRRHRSKKLDVHAILQKFSQKSRRRARARFH